uniref:Uncharacterized protein n=2 Tax=Fagus sylvatica TaxID=28930 RepID=A0A2N9HI61_FAGSY
MCWAPSFSKSSNWPLVLKTEIENLRDTVSTIHAVILDAEKKSSHSHQIKDWLRKLKDVLHDADDLLDDFSFEVLRHKVMTKKQVRLFSSSSNQLAFSLKMGHKIEAIRKRLNAIADVGSSTLMKASIEPQVMNRDRETYSFVHEEDVIGRDDDKKEITKLLLDDNVVENISIIPIVGLWRIGEDYSSSTVEKEEAEGSLENLEQLKTKMHEGSLDILEQLKEHERSFEILGELTEHEESLEILFPKDYKIQVKTLIRLWAAQGFIKLSNPKQCVEGCWQRVLYGITLERSTMVTSSEENIGEKARHVSFGPKHSSRQLPIPIVKGMKIQTVLAASVGGELATNMKEKQHLQRLGLGWKRMSDRETECYDEESLEGLQPHPNLKALELSVHLPPLNKLPFLKSLSLNGLEALEYISEEEDSVSNVFGGSSSSSSKTIEFFPSLSSLYICSKVLQQTMKMGTRQRASTATTSTSTSSSSCFPLSQLQSLELWDVTELEFLPEEWLGNLTSLQHLVIGNCPNLTSLPQGIRNLKSLHRLEIRRCPILGQRCQRQTGEDWPNIAHVPYVEVDGKKQQQETIPSS